MKSRVAGCLWIAGICGLLLSCGGSSSSSSSTGSLLIASQGDMAVASLDVNLSTGTLTSRANSVTTGAGSVPVAMVLTPNGGAAFVANQGTNDIAAFSVAADGTIAAAGANVPVGTNPVSLAVDPGGHFLFVANQGTSGITGSSSISVFGISGTTLTPVGTFPTADYAAGIAVPAVGNFVYVTNNVNSEVSGYVFDGVTGAITGPTNGSPYLAGTTPMGLAFDRTGGFLYVANFGSNNVSGFNACTQINILCPIADGSLFPTTKSPFSAGIGPTSVAAHPMLNSVYVSNFTSNNISQFKLSTATGELTPLSPSTAATGANPVWMGIHPAGQYLYSANISGASITGFHINQTTGILGPLPHFTTGGQPSALVLK